MIKSILQTAFNPPQFNEQMYQKEHCLKKLEDAANKRLLFIRAGVGFGKTSLLALFYKQIEEAKIWFSIPEVYFTFEKLVTHIFYGTMQKLEGSKRDKWDVIWQKVAIGAIELDQMVSYLLNLIDDIPGNLYLFLDDFQYLQLEGRELDLQALQMFARFTSEKVHFVIASREELPIPLNRFRLETKMVEITEKDLTLDREELRRFLAQNQVAFDEQRLGWLYQKTEGWVAGVCLFLYFYGNNLLQIKDLSSTATVKEYLGEILAGIPLKTREFLSKTAVFDMIPVNICNLYLGIHDSQRILDELVESRLLTYRYDEDGESYYRYHNLLKDYFLSQLTKEEQKVYHRQLAEVFIAVGQMEMGITHLIMAEEDQKAIELIKKEAPKALASSDVNLLTDWLDYIESKIVTDEPILDLYRGQVREVRGRLDEAEEYYLKAEAGLLEFGDMSNWVRVKTQIAGIYWWKKDFERCMQICRDTKNHLDKADKDVQSGLYNLMGTSSMFLKERSKGIEYLIKARELAHECNDLNGESWILNNLAFTGYLPQGKIQKAIQIYEEAMKNFRKLKNRQGLAIIMSNLGYIYLNMRELDLAEPLFTEAEEIYLEMGNKRSIRSVWILKTRLELARGNLKRAGELLEKIKLNLHPNDSHMFLSLYALASSMFYINNGEGEKALEWMEQAIQHIPLCDEDSQMVQEMYLQRIEFYILIGEYVKAIRFAEELLKQACGEGYELTRIEASLLLGIAQKEEFGEIDSELSKLLGKLNKGPFVFLQKKYASIVSLLGNYLQEEERKVEVKSTDNILRVNFFGKFVIKHFGQSSSVEDWSNRKAFDLFKFLILHHDQWVTQEEILQHFWPNTATDRGKQTLYVALYTIRKKMGPDTEKSKKLIQSRKGMYRIVFPLPYWLDIEAFTEVAKEGLQLYKEGSLPKAQELLQEALRLYQGDFLEENIYDEWTCTSREEYLQLYQDLLITLANIQGEIGNFLAAVELLNQVLKKNPFLDGVHKTVMEYMIQGGFMNEAIQHFREYSEIYEEELGVEMPEEVQQIYANLVTRK